LRKLFLDIETTPHVAFVWRLFDENIGLNQLIEPTRMLCVAYKFENEKTQFAAEWEKGGHKKMLAKVHAAISEADAIVHYNGASFDEPHMNREFLQAGFDPPTRPQTIDLYRTIKSRFRFASNKLEHVAAVMNLREGKLKTDFTLWSRVLKNDKAARAEMKAYNIEDVELLVDLYNEILPWIDRHPNVALYEGDMLMRCTRCASDSLVKDGFHRTTAGEFQRYRCRECGGLSRGAKRGRTTPLREA
jgi:uncharacterized protein YprB with RNaseH-like and TPR domain